MLRFVTNAWRQPAVRASHRAVHIEHGGQHAPRRRRRATRRSLKGNGKPSSSPFTAHLCVRCWMSSSEPSRRSRRTACSARSSSSTRTASTCAMARRRACPGEYNAAIDGIEHRSDGRLVRHRRVHRQRRSIVSDIQTDPLVGGVQGPRAGSTGCAPAGRRRSSRRRVRSSEPSRSTTASSPSPACATARSSSCSVTPPRSSSSATRSRSSEPPRRRCRRERRPSNSRASAAMFEHAPAAIAVLRGRRSRLRGREPEVPRARRAAARCLGKPVAMRLPELAGQGFYRASRRRLDEPASRTSAAPSASCSCAARRARARRPSSTSSTSRCREPTAAPTTILVVAFEVTDLVRAKLEPKPRVVAPRRASDSS